MSKGNLIVISGSSGVGKSTVLKRVMAERSDLQFSVSATTRAPRPGETDGVSYYFLTKDKFKSLMEEDAFVETDFHMDNYYGTLKSELLNKTRDGNLILDIEPNGAMNVRAVYPDATLVFIAPPSLETLEQRIRGRGDTAEEQIKIRMERVRWELSQKDRYDYVVINDDLDLCVKEVLDIISKKLDN